MILKLMWKDRNKNIYHIGNLLETEGIYVFQIIEENLKQAIKAGCMGIGEFDLLNTYYKSEELFDFFKQRIPSKDYKYINEILERYELKEYDEMLLLQKTKGQLMTDRYYLEKKTEKED